MTRTLTLMMPVTVTVQVSPGSSPSAFDPGYPPAVEILSLEAADGAEEEVLDRLGQEVAR